MLLFSPTLILCSFEYESPPNLKLCKLVVLYARYKCTEFDEVLTSFARAIRVQSLHVHRRVKLLKIQSDVSPRPFVRFTSNFQGVLKVTRPSTSRKISAPITKIRLPRAFYALHVQIRTANSIVSQSDR